MTAPPELREYKFKWLEPPQYSAELPEQRSLQSVAVLSRVEPLAIVLSQ